MKTKFMIPVMLLLTLSLAMSAQAKTNHRIKSKKNMVVHKRIPHYKYSKLPKWGHVSNSAPRNSLIITHKGLKYHYNSGIFYKHSGKKYIIVKAPIGLKVKSLPANYLRFKYNGKKYYYYYGTFYIKADKSNNYITINPPVCAMVDALPDGYKKIHIDGNVYYKFEGTYYKEVIKNNEEMYEVVGERIR